MLWPFVYGTFYSSCSSKPTARIFCSMCWAGAPGPVWRSDQDRKSDIGSSSSGRETRYIQSISHGARR